VGAAVDPKGYCRMTEQRQFWPTESHLARLRAQGLMPYSALAAQCAATLAAGVFCYHAIGAVPEAAAQFERLFTAAAPGAVPELQIGAVVRGLLVLPAISVAAVVLILGLAQTRFYLGAQALRFDLQRIAPRLGQLQPAVLVVRGVVALICTAVLLAAGLGIAGVGLRGLLPLLSWDSERVPFWLGQVASKLAWTGVVVLLVLGGLSAVLGRLRFKLKNRMTRSELEQELRDGAS
ncbi:MAG: hypothetical protein EBZ48_03765, partial [Proteobacteria bacterium]|nr:hypothetical protein [Pseudomonadota bacterium]